jgi:hypothetical protein
MSKEESSNINPIPPWLREKEDSKVAVESFVLPLAREPKVLLGSHKDNDHAPWGHYW